MADERVRHAVKITDPTTDANEATVSATGALLIDVEEFPAAAALSDAFANPTTTSIAAMAMGWNGATWDRLYVVSDGDAVAAASTGILALGSDGANYQVIATDASGNVQVDVVAALPAGSNEIGDIGSINTNVVPGVAATSLGKAVDAVAGAADTGVAVLVERVDTPAAITPANGDYTVLSVDANGRLHVTDPGAGGGTTDVDDDVVAGGQTASLQIGLNYGWDGTQWERLTTDAAGSLDVNVTLALPTGTNEIGDIGSINTNVVPGVAATSLGKAIDTAVGATDTGVAALVERVDTPAAITPANGDFTTLQVDANGRLHVTDPNAGAGTPGTPTVDTPALATVAAGAASTGTELRTADLGGTSRQLAGVDVSSSAPFKATLIREDDDVETIVNRGLFGQAGTPLQWRPPNKAYYSDTFGANAGFDGYRVEVTNLDNSQSADFYVNFYYED